MEIKNNLQILDNTDLKKLKSYVEFNNKYFMEDSTLNLQLRDTIKQILYTFFVSGVVDKKDIKKYLKEEYKNLDELKKNILEVY